MRVQVDTEKGLAAIEAAVVLREAQIEDLGENGERAMLATSVMEHATATVNLASAYYVCKKMDEAKVWGACVSQCVRRRSIMREGVGISRG